MNSIDRDPSTTALLFAPLSESVGESCPAVFQAGPINNASISAPMTVVIISLQ